MANLRPSREQLMEMMQGLTPEQQAQFMDQIEKRWPAPEGTIKQSTAFEKPISMMPSVPDFPISLPSPETMTDFIPAAGGVIGGALGSAPGAAAGAGIGEAIRMGIRKLAGKAPATGFVSGQLGMDPNSPEAMATNIAAETVGGGASTAAAKWANKVLAPWFREKGLRTYAGGLAPNEFAEESVTNRLRPIQEELPVGTRGHINRVAQKEAEAAGTDVRHLYTQSPAADLPASYDPAAQVMKGLRDQPKIVARPGQWDYYTDANGQLRRQWVPPDIIDKPLWKSFNEEIANLRAAEYKGRIPQPSPIPGGGSPQEITVKDVFNRREGTGQMAARKTAKAFQQGAPPSHKLTPSVQALKAERQALADTLHGKLPGTTATPEMVVPSGKSITGEKADELFTAWKTLMEGTPKGPNIFSRWLASRSIPGRAGTAAGALVSNQMLVRSLGYKGMRALGAALQAGDEQAVNQIMRGVMTKLNLPEEPQ